MAWACRPARFSATQAVKANARERLGTPPPARVIPDPKDRVRAQPKHKETLAELRKVDLRVPVVLSSGYNEAETMRLFAGQDVAGFIQKPYTSGQLARKVKGALGGGGR